MVDVTTRIRIDAPPASVAAVAGDPSNAPSWYANIKSVTWETEPPVRVGSRMAFTAFFLGRNLGYTYEVSEFEPGKRLVMRTADGPFPMETTYTWAAQGEGTEMTLRNRGTPAGFSKFASPFMSFAMRRANNHDLRRLKVLIERGGLELG